MQLLPKLSSKGLAQIFTLISSEKKIPKNPEKYSTIFAYKSNKEWFTQY